MAFGADAARAPTAVDETAGLANSLVAQGRLPEALEALQSSSAYDPSNAHWHFERASLLDRMGRSEEAFEACKAALDLNPDDAQGYASLGLILRKLELYDGAITAFEEAVRRDPSLAPAWHNLAVTQRLFGRFEDARRNFEAVLVRDPLALLTRIELAYMRRLVCDWEGLEAEEHECLCQFRAGNEVIPPFVLFSMPASPADQQEAARRYALRTGVPPSARFRHVATKLGVSGRLKLGYLSSDFGNHATSLLLADILETHDRSRFEVFTYSFGSDDDSRLRRRISAGVDRFVDIRDLSHRDAACRINDDGVDILVDLNGFTRHSRPEIASHRPAPVQVNYLGYPATMGADYMDYFIADGVTVPEASQSYFTENVVRLSGCYQPNDRQREVAPLATSRAREGLPEAAIVFCCFNGSWKINAMMFDVWMRLLHRFPGSVLWLLKSNGSTTGNLRQEASIRGIAPERLVFAEKVSNAQHLTRHVLADIFLDCIPCNAHTTASDALWAGLPVITCSGETFASRVAGSLLKAVGLAELAAGSLEEYERIALSLAGDKARLEDIKSRLKLSRATMPLFDTVAYTRDLKSAFLTMAETYCKSG